MNLSTHKRSEVDIRVAQELKNHRDFVYLTGQQINTLNEGVIALSVRIEKILANAESNRKELLIEFENMKDWVESTIQGMIRRLGEAEIKVAELLRAFSDLKLDLADGYTTRDEFINVVDPIENRLSWLEEEFVQKNEYFNLAVHTVRDQFKDQLEGVKKDLTPVPPEVDPVKQQIDERLKVFKVDFDGLVKEITLLKKTVAYDQKKFENIYTLIERLKEGKQ